MARPFSALSSSRCPGFYIVPCKEAEHGSSGRDSRPSGRVLVTTLTWKACVWPPAARIAAREWTRWCAPSALRKKSGAAQLVLRSDLSSSDSATCTFIYHPERSSGTHARRKSYLAKAADVSLISLAARFVTTRQR